MNNTHQIIVFLWFVPVAVLIVLPLLGSILSLLYRAIERSSLEDINGYVVLNNRNAGSKGEAEHRNRPRIHLDVGKAFIDDTGGCGKAVVSDISNEGISLKNVPKGIHLESRPFRVIFRTREKDYTVTARPIWKRIVGRTYVIGAEIERIPRGWKELVTGLSHTLSPKTA